MRLTIITETLYIPSWLRLTPLLFYPFIVLLLKCQTLIKRGLLRLYSYVLWPWKATFPVCTEDGVPPELLQLDYHYREPTERLTLQDSGIPEKEGKGRIDSSHPAPKIFSTTGDPSLALQKDSHRGCGPVPAPRAPLARCTFSRPWPL